jgi:Zn-dependent peptidase ImmA (M78 family)
MDSFNPHVLEAILAARGLNLRTISTRLGVAEGDLREQITSGPSQKVINDLSDELVVPSFVFYMDHPPKLGETIVDFRSATPFPTPKTRQTMAAIDMAQRIQEVAESVQYGDDLQLDFPPNTLASAETARTVRKYLGISDADQLNAKDAAAFYNVCRKAIEDKGIFVLHDSFPSEDGSGFCLSDSPARLIVINTRNQTPGRRTFTLIHELGHVLIHRSGISDPFITTNSTERACNRFAGRFLAPKHLAEAAFRRFDLTSDPSTDDIYRAARYLKLSQEAVVVRFVQLNLVSPDTHQKWLRAVQANGGNPDWSTPSGGGGSLPQERVKLTKYGFTFARVFNQALRRRQLSPLDVYRISGLKPKYQQAYFDFATSAGSDDVEL